MYPKTLVSLHVSSDAVPAVTLRRSSAWVGDRPPCFTKAQNVVLYRLLIWPAQESVRTNLRSTGVSTIDLPPAHVVPEKLLAWVKHGPSVKGRQGRREWFGREERGPQEHVIGCKG